jgi:hypothetical protein
MKIFIKEVNIIHPELFKQIQDDIYFLELNRVDDEGYIGFYERDFIIENSIYSGMEIILCIEAKIGQSIKDIKYFYENPPEEVLGEKTFEKFSAQAFIDGYEIRASLTYRIDGKLVTKPIDSIYTDIKIQ